MYLHGHGCEWFLANIDGMAALAAIGHTTLKHQRCYRSENVLSIKHYKHRSSALCIIVLVLS